ncbi:VQ motif-containing protein 4 [Telopea speciosissima]|uniref:VQ motif-containing protein 4 n=1 Tax=Telopea speciosissima TaxID=54955 RepID=UPI001CC67C45|nr:VQ motif-containing protein 4 [Telopea speciosissima]XP_043701910.1 VQ motif-containing protein 4 [Telopea speciosissima]
MENSPRRQEGENPSALTSPKSNSSSSSSSNSNGVQLPLTPKPISRSDANAYPTTFIQADTSSFKQVVQMLTGSSETAKQASKANPADPSNKSAIPPIKSGPKKQGFKLYERRNSLKNLKISPLMPGALVHPNSGFSPRKPEILSPSLLDFPGLVLSPVTPLIPDPFNRSPPTCNSNDSMAEEKAIAEKGFYLHPSPITTPRDSEPRLLPLFPVTSPKVSGSS